MQAIAHVRPDHRLLSSLYVLDKDRRRLYSMSRLYAACSLAERRSENSFGETVLIRYWEEDATQMHMFGRIKAFCGCCCNYVMVDDLVGTEVQCCMCERVGVLWVLIDKTRQIGLKEYV
jgi:hypothetical protein